MKRKIAAVALGLVLPVLWVAGETAGLVPLDLFFGTALRLQGPQTRSTKEGVSPVLFVEIDGASLDALGPWPWPKASVEDLVRKLANWGAQSIVLDPSVLEGGTIPDSAFWASVPGSTALVAPLVAATDGASSCRPQFPPALASASGFARLERLSAPAGLACSDRFLWGFDALPRAGTLAWPLLGNDGQNLVPSLPVAALLASTLVDQRRTDWWSESDRAILAARGAVRVGADGTVLMRPYGAPGSSVARVSAMSVLSEQLAADQFRQRVVVLGVTAGDLSPRMAVPFAGPFQGRAMPRPEALANILNNLIEQEHHRVASWGRWASLALVVPALVAAFLGMRLRRRWIPFAGAGVLFAIAMGGVWFFYHDLHLWLPPFGGILVPLGLAAFAGLWPRPAKPSVRETSGNAIPRQPTSANLPARPRPDDTGTRQVAATAPPPERPTSTTIPVRTADEATSVVMAARGQDGQVVRGPGGEFVQLGRYVDLHPLATGGMCSVYEGRDPLMDRRVAIKILRSDKAKGQTTEQRFVREAKIAGSLNHPNINTVFDYGQVEETSFLVLEFVDGQTLSQWIREHNGVQPLQVVPWVRQIGDALDTAHRAEVIHRDIKPSNFMIVATTGAIKLMDFGVARTPGATLTQVGTTVGTPNYMSPEQLQGSRVGPRADLYSFGVVAYQMLTQRLPFHGEGLTALCNNILKGNATKLSVHRPDLAGPVEEVVHRAFAARPEDRFANCMEFAEAFAKAASR